MLDQFHKVAEIVASFAIVGSLIFVGLQVSQNTTAVQVSNSQAATQFWTDAGLAVANDRGLAEILVADRYPELSGIGVADPDVMRTVYFVTVSLRHVENNYLQWRNGTLSDEIWHGNRRGVVAGFAIQRSYAEYWKNSRNSFSEPFRELIDDVVVEAEDLRRNIALQSTNGSVAEGS